MAEPESSTSNDSKPTSRPRSEDKVVVAAIDQCNEILSDITELPDRAYDFGSSVEAKVVEIREWIEENMHVTPAQQEALDSMQGGVQRWLN